MARIAGTALLPADRRRAAIGSAQCFGPSTWQCEQWLGLADESSGGGQRGPWIAAVLCALWS